MIEKSQIHALVERIGELNAYLSSFAQEGVDVELDFVSDDDSDADLIDLVSIKQRVWEPELED
jgi:hypothetical protein